MKGDITSDAAIVIIGAQSYDSEEVTPQMRFVERDGRRILQQQWAITSYGGAGHPTGFRSEWRDVPLCSESDPIDSE